MMKIFGEGKILGREPTLWIAGFTALINLLVGFQLDWLSPEQAALMSVFVNAAGAVFVAFQTRPVAPNVFSYAVSALAGLLGAYGLNLSQEMVSSIQTLVLFGFTLGARAQVSPKPDADKTGVLGDKVTTGDVPQEVVEEIKEELPTTNPRAPLR